MKVGKTLLKSKMMAIVALVMLAIISFSCGFGLIGYSKVSKAASITPIEGETDYVDALRYGYNVTAGKPIYDDGLNIANPILEPISERLYAYIAKTEMNTKTESGHHVETSAVSVAKQLTTNTTGGIEAKVGIVNTNIDTVFDRSNASTEAYSEQYETYYQNIKRISYVIQGNVDLRNYLAKDFKDELYSIKNKNDALYILKKYGTHLFTGFDYGGMLEVTNFIQTKSSSVDLSQMDSLSTKMGIAMGSYGAGVSFSFSEQFASSEQKEFGVSNYKANIYGGESVAALTIDQLFTYNSSLVDGNGNYVYDRWVKSINEKKSLAIIGTPGSARNIPLWELVDDQAKYYSIKSCLQVAYAELCGDEYQKYLEKYPTTQRTIAEDSEKGAHGVVGYSLLNNENVTYHEGEKEASENKVAEKSKIYMSFFPIVPTGRVFEWRIIEGEDYATVVDAKRGIFLVNDEVIGSDNKNMQFDIALCSDEDIIYSKTFTIVKEAFSGGVGTEESPYLISTAKDFYAFAKDDTYWGDYFRLINDIDLKYNEGLDEEGEKGGFRSIGEENLPFIGVFDGADYTISNIWVNQTRGKAIGLFAYSEGTIQNLRLANVVVTTSTTIDENGKTTWAIYNSDSRDNSTHKDLVTSDADIDYAGGLVGCNMGGKIANCMISNVSVQADYQTTHTATTADPHYMYAGGLVGYSASHTTIEECSVIGVSVYAELLQTNKKNTINVSAGGLVGYAKATTIKNVYVKNIGQIYSQCQASQANVYASGLVGIAVGGDVVIDSSAVVSYNKIKAKHKDCNTTSYEVNHILVAKSEKENEVSPSIKSCVYKTDANLTAYPTDVQNADAKGFDEVVYNSYLEYYLSPKKWVANSKDKTPALISQEAASYSVMLDLDNAITTYYYGESFTIAGVVVNVRNNKNNEQFVIDRFTFDTDKFDSKVLGAYNIKVTALGTTKIYQVIVREIEVVGLAIEYTPEYTATVGEQPDANDYNIYYVLESGEKVNVNDEKVDYINYPKKSIKLSTEEYVEGENLVKVTCGELSGSVIVEAEENKAVNLTVKENPTKMEYYVSEKLSLEGIKVQVTFENGAEKIVGADELEVFASTISEGENTIIISYGDYCCLELEDKVIGIAKTDDNYDAPSGGNSGSETPSNPSEGQGGSSTNPPSNPGSSGTTEMMGGSSAGAGTTTGAQTGSLSTVESILMIVGIIALVGAVIFVVKRLFLTNKK